MEMLEEKIKEFLSNGDGYGDGYGNGYGNGDGYGDGDGYGYKDVSKYNGHRVYKINGLPTIITFIKNDFAKGFVFNKDMTLIPCYVAKFEGAFAHGKTIKEAYEALQEKLLEDMPVEERIEKFLKEF